MQYSIIKRQQTVVISNLCHPGRLYVTYAGWEGYRAAINGTTGRYLMCRLVSDIYVVTSRDGLSLSPWNHYSKSQEMYTLTTFCCFLYTDWLLNILYNYFFLLVFWWLCQYPAYSTICNIYHMKCWINIYVRTLQLQLTADTLLYFSQDTIQYHQEAANCSYQKIIYARQLW